MSYYKKRNNVDKKHNKEIKWRESGKDIELLKEQWENSKNYKSYNYNIKKKLITLLKIVPIIILLIMIINIYSTTIRPITIELNVLDSKRNTLENVNIFGINPKYKAGKVEITSSINSEKEIIISKENYRPDTLQIIFDKNKSITTVLKQYYTFTIQAKNAAGDFVKSEDVIITGENGETEGLTDNKGKFSFKLLEGQYTITILGNRVKSNLFKNINKTIVIKEKKFIYLGKNNRGYKEYKNEKDGSILVYIPAGEFTMGSNDGDDDEKPMHTVYLDGYYISKYEITNKQYKQFCDETVREYPKDPEEFTGINNYFSSYPNYPVVEVSWNDAVAYCDWAGLRLPTEAEWQKGARGTDGRKYPWGNSEPNGSQCNYDDKSLSKYYDYNWIDKNVNDGYAFTSPVGNYSSGASPYGLMDMSGNVWEWVNDWYGEDYYSVSPKSNPKGPSSGSSRVLCGGSWLNPDYSIRSSYRNYNIPTYCWRNCGFRPAF